MSVDCTSMRISFHMFVVISSNVWFVWSTSFRLNDIQEIYLKNIFGTIASARLMASGLFYVFNLRGYCVFLPTVSSPRRGTRDLAPPLHVWMVVTRGLKMTPTPRQDLDRSTPSPRPLGMTRHGQDTPSAVRLLRSRGRTFLFGKYLCIYMLERTKSKTCNKIYSVPKYYPSRFCRTLIVII